jgi:outer membrane protein OmpA-like peptidoglycan-associated protein
LNQDQEVIIKNAEIKKNSEGAEVTEVGKDSVIELEDKAIKTQVLMEISAREQADQVEFILDNIIKFDKDSSNIHKFTSDVFDKLFGGNFFLPSY